MASEVHEIKGRSVHSSKRFVVLCVVVAFAVLVVAFSTVRRKTKEIELSTHNTFPYSPPDDAARAKLQESLYTHILKGMLSDPHCKERVRFIALGFDKGGTRFDPTREFIDQLGKFPMVLRPVSEAGFSRYDGIYTRDTQEPAIIHSVMVLRWIDDTTAAVALSNVRGDLSGFGESDAVYHFNGEEWELIMPGQRWLS
ncbi:hypothetical protein [Planctomicrobium piriforme]|uniref:Uncharacterized protein n=1 Tax=Planctomicrobium piriforme TaxID=1576369 RepID=A0A1I3NLI4_9PLAN|nr:hypothetical protein [Planctomicrobium piriforme]SFJ09830.1 hypothetical protein SAMN05421753_115129 [Planctomicrobium piriforme]